MVPGGGNDRKDIARIKEAADCRSIFKRFWPRNFQERGNCFCPFHDDSQASLQVSRQMAFCHAEGRKFDAIDLYVMATGASLPSAISALGAEAGLPATASGRADPKSRAKRTCPGERPGRIAAVYDYTNAEGRLLYQTVRFEPKGFRQRRPRSPGGGWIWSLAGVVRVPYRLPQALKADTVFVVEGEKDADRLAAIGLAATTNSEGAGKWRPELSGWFAGKNVVVLPDNDQAGKRHALDVREKLIRAGAGEVKIVDLPGLPPKGDVSDWLNSGGGREELVAIVRSGGVSPQTGLSAENAADPGACRGGGWLAGVPPLSFPSETPQNHGWAVGPPAGLRPCKSAGRWEEGSEAGEEEGAKGFRLTEDGIALVFAERFAHSLRYCHHTGSWFRWSGGVSPRTGLEIGNAADPGMDRGGGGLAGVSSPSFPPETLQNHERENNGGVSPQTGLPAENAADPGMRAVGPSAGLRPCKIAGRRRAAVGDVRPCKSAGRGEVGGEVGGRWVREETGLAFDLARSLCRELNSEALSGGAANSKHGRKLSTVIARASTALAVERFARADRRLAVTSDIWDRDIWLLNTPSGTVDLRSGVIRPAAREDFITRQTLASPSRDSASPLWRSFLRDVTREDEDLQRFLCQMAGMCLTGSIREHALFFIFGRGGNGKSVFLNTLVNILGDYARTAAMDTFTASRSERHPTELAMLRGARLVCASETEEGRAWAEGRIKQLTGGERISARFMRQDFFEFAPQFKLVIIGNHKPILRNVDPAARRRFHIIPFVHTPQRPDKQLEEKLGAEYPAILRWMIEGCMDWRQHGLVRPRAVLEATENYFEEQDFLGRWIEEHCTLSSRDWETTTRLFSHWKGFAEANGEYPGTARSFGLTLSRRGFQSGRATVSGATQRIFRGIALKAAGGG